MKKKGCGIQACKFDIPKIIRGRYEVLHEKSTSRLDARKRSKTDACDGAEMNKN